MDRTSMLGMPAMGMGIGAQTMNMPMGGAAGTMNMMMIPRCSMKMEKCDGGMKIMCACSDDMAKSMMQHLCTMLAGGMVSCCMTMNGMMMMCCNMTMGMCKMEMTKDGCCITCTSGDEKCCKMIQKCCESMMAMMECGCTCCVCMNGTPICCGCC